MQETRSTVCDVIGYEGAYFTLNHSVLIINFWPFFCIKMDKKLSASGGLSPPDLPQGLCPWTPLGTPPPNPCYRLALHARHDVTPTFKHLPRSMVCIMFKLFFMFLIYILDSCSACKRYVVKVSFSLQTHYETLLSKCLILLNMLSYLSC